MKVDSLDLILETPSLQLKIWVPVISRIENQGTENVQTCKRFWENDLFLKERIIAFLSLRLKILF